MVRRGLKTAGVIVIAAMLSGAGCAPAGEAIPAVCSGKSVDSIGGPFSLINQDGQPVTEAAFQDKPAVFYFGYTYCPDVCPLTLSRLKAAFDALGPDAAKAHTVFVTVDPERDTPEALKAYLANPAFPENTVGLTGSNEQVQAALKAFRIAARLEKDPDNPNKYEVSHSSLIYLMTSSGAKTSTNSSNSWRLAAFLPDSTPPAEIAACTKAAIAGKL